MASDGQQHEQRHSGGNKDNGGQRQGCLASSGGAHALSTSRCRLTARPSGISSAAMSANLAMLSSLSSRPRSGPGCQGGERCRYASGYSIRPEVFLKERLSAGIVITGRRILAHSRPMKTPQHQEKPHRPGCRCPPPSPTAVRRRPRLQVASRPPSASTAAHPPADAAGCRRTNTGGVRGESEGAAVRAQARADARGITHELQHGHVRSDEDMGRQVQRSSAIWLHASDTRAADPLR